MTRIRLPARFAEVEGYAVIAEFTEVDTVKGADALERWPQVPRLALLA